MFKDAMILYKKELKNIFKDRRTLFAVLGLPINLIPIIFITKGKVTAAQQKSNVETVYTVEFRNLPDPRFETILSGMLSYDIAATSEGYSMVEDQDTYIIVEFPSDSKGKLEKGEKIDPRIYYRSTSQKSSFAAQIVRNALGTYSTQVLLADKLKDHDLTLEDLNMVEPSMDDVAPEEVRGSNFLAMMIPYFVLIYIFAGSMNIGLDTTAGEKERGSMASILVNQVSRTSIALGKVMYVMTIGILNSVATFAGLIIAFSVMGNMFGESELSINLSGVSSGPILGLLLGLLTISGLAASLIVFLGSLARNIKEGGGYIMPVYILAIVMGVATMQMEPSKQISLYLIPILNSIFVMKDLIMGQFAWARFVLMLISNGALISVLIYAVAKLFNSEKILNTGE